MAKAKRPVIGITAPVTITAGEAEGDKPAGPAKFETTFYTGGALEIEGWDLPVVVDLAGLNRGNVLVANLDHDRTKRVGNFDVANDGKSLVARGTATAKTPARDEVVGSALEGYQWQSSLEVNPHEVEEIKAGKKVTVNSQSFTGPLYVTRKGTLKGFGFVSHGADDQTTVSIAASAASTKGTEMKAEVKAWAEGMGIDLDAIDDDQKATIEANYEGRSGKSQKAAEPTNPFEVRRLEAKRRKQLRDIADTYLEQREPCSEEDIIAVEKMHDHAAKNKMTPQEFRAELLESSYSESRPLPNIQIKTRGYTERVLSAAVCESGRLSNIDKHFKDEELQAAHDLFPDGISLNQLFLVAAQQNGYNGTAVTKVNIEVQRAAFRLNDNRRFGPIRGSGFSTIDIANVVSATANKFLHEGWMSVDQTALRIANIKSVNNFHQITTVSLIGALEFEKLGADGEIKHGTLDDLTYTNQIDTYARMLAITRKDLINDDLGALTAVPRRLGRGGMLKLNDIFWTEFLGLVAANFFASGNNNINTGVADMTIGGLSATETIFMNQVDPDGKPLAVEPAILLVPPALKATAIALTDPQSMMTGGSSNVSTANPFRGRFRVESSPYISNSSYTGNTAVGWWMLANPSDIPVISIAALNGRVEPNVDTADADFHQLGVQMRGYSDIGVNEQEYRAGVYADGGSS